MTGELRERVEAIPGMERVIPALEGLPPAYLVGGAVRDLLLGIPSTDLDVVVEGDAVAEARTLAERRGGEFVRHERFGTATVRADGLTLDLATTRRESYPEPGALPIVEPAGLLEDLARRDFTVNAMAIGLTGDDEGVLHDPHGGREDLDRGTIRVLHDRSFIDDPTRLLRAVRYETRLGFSMDPDTERLARAQAEGDGFSTVSGPRVRDELLDLLRERDVATAVERLRELRLDRALHPAVAADSEIAARARDAAVEIGADPALAALASFLTPDPDGLSEWVESLHLGRGPSAAVLRAARKGPQLVPALRTDLPPSAVHALLHCEPLEALALAVALGAPERPVLAYLDTLKNVKLAISGDDLVAAGVPQSPAIGRALRETLRLKLDGVVSGREDELAAALETARQWEAEE
ncbi:MAG: CCA tRNA nucleotidyltransferase [Thermoleophilaceae bacterium]